MIYLDHASATPVHPQVLAAMLPYFSERFFNPSAPYLPAKRVREAYEEAKNQIARVIGAKGADLVITSGATESINLAFTVCSAPISPKIAAPMLTAGKKSVLKTAIPPAFAPKVLILATEHAAVIEAAKQFDYDLLRVDRAGLINLQDLRAKLTPDVVLVSVSLANNEIGTIQPLVEISAIIRQVRQERYQQGNTMPLYLHSDASQALNLLDVNISRLGVDMLTINAAKCGGPKGIGALYLAHGVPVRPLSVGGGQERGLRSGTENVPGVIGFAAAATFAKQHLACSRKTYQEMASVLRRELAHTPIISQNSEKVNSKTTAQSTQGNKTSDNQSDHQYLEPIFLGSLKHQLASFVPVCFPGIDAERLIYRLEQRGVYVSTGAACAANKGAKSHVLAAVGLSDTEIAGSIRISLGSTNTLENVTEAARIIREEVEREYDRLRQQAEKKTTQNSQECDDTRAINAQNQAADTDKAIGNSVGGHHV